MRVTRFSGLLPAVSPKHLQRGFASRAENVRVTNGTLRALRTPKLIGQCAGEFVLASSGEFTCGAPCSLPAVGCEDDTITVKEGALQYLDGTAVVADPPAAPTFTSRVSEGTTAIAFRVTAINARGDESPASDILGPVDIDPSKRVFLSVPGRVNVYASVPSTLDTKAPADGSTGAVWALVGEFTDTAAIAIKPEEWALTSDNLIDETCRPTGIVCVARDEVGFAYAWGKSEVWVSERNSVTLWPLRGHITLEHNIEHAVATPDGLLVLTSGVPFIVRPSPANDGTVNPRADIINAHHPLIGGKDNVTPVPNGLVYASTTGLVGLSPQVATGFQLLTKNVFETRDWQEKWAPKALAAHHGDLVSDRWVFDYNDPNQGRIETSVVVTHTFPADRLQSLPDGRLLHYANGEVSLWEGGDYARAVYETEVTIEQGRRIFTAAKVVGQNIGGVLFELIDADSGQVVAARTLTGGDTNKPFRLPARRRQHYTMRLTLPAGRTQVVIEEVHVAADINDLAKPEGVAE